MKLQQLFYHLKDVNQSLPPLEIESVVCDTRQVGLGALFVAVRGETVDGHDYLEDAVRKGALVLVVENPKKFLPTLLVWSSELKTPSRSWIN